MHAPGWWYPKNSDVPWQARLLAPLGRLYPWIGARRRRGRPGYDGAVPIICIGNLVAGGVGKTPVAIAIGRRLIDRGLPVHFLTRGHGGKLAGPVQVDAERHTVGDIGDEPQLLAVCGPTWVARDRVAGARAAAEAGAEVIVMDDGFQNHPSLSRDCALVVVDSETGFGNGQLIPAGPLREPIESGFARAHGIVVMGAFSRPLPDPVAASGKPVLRAQLLPVDQGASLENEEVVAFAGIGRPEKFFNSLALQLGCKVADTEAFPDHGRYTKVMIDRLKAQADRQDALLVTTEKDMARIPPDARAGIYIVMTELVWEDEASLDRLLDAALNGVSAGSAAE